MDVSRPMGAMGACQVFSHSSSGAMSSPVIDDMSTDIYSVELQWHHSALERDFRSTLSLSFMNDFGIQHGVPLRLGLLRANEQVQVGRSRVKVKVKCSGALRTPAYQ